MAAETPAPAPWYAAYPAPKSEAATMPREEVLVMLKEQRPGKDFVLVDLRRNDHEGGTIRGSINLPAQSLYPSLPTIYRMFKEAGVRRVIWYCGSSRGRGSRATSWFADLIASEGDTSMQSLALLEGIRGWANAGGEYVEWMDGYEAAVWTKSG
ncbi:Rhodanese-like domain-containing protein [Diplogelasinospora grovesii]|uniref:Rhodanese-like domain-containing protein n=1 Tax=Diplogelasinospora grovesii TaxID=303347 RepID=A0AAN6N209_9PEZI|nr:Rhodanese-like domain-containing protein [Diplogelasinospora grovesii]